jgi:hypothetical protein
MRSVRLHLLAALSTVAAIAATLGTTASVASAANCPPPPTSSAAFSSFGDAASYVLANNGSFDPLAKGSKESPWALSGGASVVGENEPWNLGRGTTQSALALPAGSSAVSGCTTAPMITSVVRFFVKNTGSPNGHLHVEVIVNGGKNGILDGGTITAGSNWAPTSQIVLPWANPLKGAVQLQVRLTPVEPDASFTVDDVYIDPFCSR